MWSEYIISKSILEERLNIETFLDLAKRKWKRVSEETFHLWIKDWVSYLHIRVFSCSWSLYICLYICHFIWGLELGPQSEVLRELSSATVGTWLACWLIFLILHLHFLQTYWLWRGVKWVYIWTIEIIKLKAWNLN